MTDAAPDRSFWQGRRVLLTGHTGFKGSWLALWLMRLGAEVVGVSLDPPTTPSLCEQLGLGTSASLDPRSMGQLDDRRLDLLDQAALERLVRRFRPQVVLHLAAQSLVRAGYRQPLATWSTNVIGTLHLLEALRQAQQPCVVVAVTTDKVYANSEGGVPFREDDPLGGHDPYSASKAAMELAVASWRQSFCGNEPHQNPGLRLVTARAGNVIGGGDWGQERIVPDLIRALKRGEAISVRNPGAVRPWQHVLDCLSGYLLLAERVSQDPPQGSSFNFGPAQSEEHSVAALVQELLSHWPGSWQYCPDPQAVRESHHLALDASLARQQLDWHSRWGFAEAVAHTASWYRRQHEGASALALCLEQIACYEEG